MNDFSIKIVLCQNIKEKKFNFFPLITECFYCYLLFFITNLHDLAPCKKTDLQPPNFVVSMETKNVVHVGDKVKLHCSATGIPKPEIVWYRSGKQIRDGDEGRFTIKYEDECDSNLCSTTLIVLDILPSFEGRFTAEAINDIGVAYTDADLIVSDCKFDVKI